MRCWFIILVMATTACGPGARKSVETDDAAHVNLMFTPVAGIGNCWREDGEFVGYANCVDFLPPRRMKGIWVAQFEGSAFVPRTDIGVPEDVYIWLEPTAAMEKRSRGYKPRYFEIDFVGRRAKYDSQYGHMGGAGQLVLVDRLISMREVTKSRARATH